MLKKSEDRILDILNTSKGNILDDIELIESLKVSKEIGKAVNEKITSAIKKGDDLSLGIKQYEEVAARGVTMFFCI